MKQITGSCSSFDQMRRADQLRLAQRVGPSEWSMSKKAVQDVFFASAQGEMKLGKGEFLAKDAEAECRSQLQSMERREG